MKSRNSITLVLSIIFLFCFIPHVGASDDSGSESTDSATDVQLDNSTMIEKGHNGSSASQGTAEVDGQKKAEDKSIKGGSEPGDSKQESSSEEEAVTKEESDVESEGDNSTGSGEEETSTNNEADTDSSEETDAVEENEPVNDTGDNESEEEETSEENANTEEESEEAKENGIQLQSKSVLKKGDKNKKVKVLKENLNKLGFNGIKVTDYFGDFTEQRVKDFQDYYNLDVDGIAGESTLNKIDEILNSPLQKGEYNKDVIPFKKKLNQLGYDGIAISDNFGSHTERRVKEFQSDQGLPVSGILEEVTQTKINALSDGDFSEGDSHPRIAELKRNLNRLGFDGLAVANLYGSFTTKRVKEFQEYYGLNPTGDTDSETLKKVDEILSSPLQKGKHNKNVIPFKEKLNRLGYDGIAISDNFGSYTEKQVKAFQKDHNLAESGIIESITKKKINDVFAGIFSKGGKHESVKEMKRNLNRLGFDGLAIADSYGSFTAKRVKEFQAHYGLKATGRADLDTLKKIDSILSSPLQKGKRHKDTIDLKKRLNSLGYDGLALTTNFGSFTEKRVKQFQKDLGLPVSGIADEKTLAKIKQLEKRRVETTTKFDITLSQALDIQMDQLQQTDKYRNNPAYVSANYVEVKKGVAKTTTDLNVRSKSNASSHIYGVIPKGTEINIIKKGSSWHEIDYGAWRNPTREDVEHYLNPNNNDEFQHLSLVDSLNVSASELNKVLKGKGILEGLGQAFINGGKFYSVNEIYLISHALLETGQGTSKLANGIEVGKNKSGNLVVVTSNNKSSLTEIKTTYNMFGVGAADSDPNRLGAIRAYEEGWFTPTVAIEGGAKFISDRYVHNKYNQNTLYKMRWNPANPGYPQYATDIGWATKQVTQIKSMYSLLNNPIFKFNFVRYK